jgi:superfamily II DNA or RNA helicase
MFLASPIAWRGTLEQYVGRLHRQYNSKHEVVVYDYADIQTPVLYKMYQKRLRGYFALGYTTKSTVDGNEDLIFNESNFAESFFDDIRQAKNRAVISAPRVRESSKQRLLDEAQGIEVKIYEQNYSFAIIDGCIVWYGEINLLSPNRFGDGLVIRIPSPELAAEFRTLLPEKTIQ